MAHPSCQLVRSSSSARILYWMSVVPRWFYLPYVSSRLVSSPTARTRSHPLPFDVSTRLWRQRLRGSTAHPLTKHRSCSNLRARKPEARPRVRPQVRLPAVARPQNKPSSPPMLYRCRQVPLRQPARRCPAICVAAVILVGICLRYPATLTLPPTVPQRIKPAPCVFVISQLINGAFHLSPIPTSPPSRARIPRACTELIA
ncbi:hypothetical protein K438DRAFT_1959493 [Mycena galopus ATCC 62051]|nr:hypothetical protein K438DRAFT_1959493 [Mycena galopus ATCC 62051]